MIFEYSEYFEHLFIGGLIITALSLLPLLALIIPRDDSFEIPFRIFTVVMAISLLINSSATLKHGVHLLYEKESAKVEGVGEVTDFETFFNGVQSYQYNGKTVQACYVLIDGEKYYIMYKGDLKVGDEVQFEYLPKSRVILSIQEVDNVE